MARKPNNVHGVLLVDKDAGMTSNHVLQRAKRLLGATKGGHTGALDPLATGVLPLCFGDATKYSQYMLDADKAYETRAQLGVRTDTADADGAVIEQAAVPELSADAITQLLSTDFLGALTQTPPAYSALKHQGKKLYELAREGKAIPDKTRTIRILDNRLVAQGEDWLDIWLKCTKGTYVRSFVEDVAAALGTVAHVARLRRLQHGNFDIAQCVSLEQFEAMTPEERQAQLLPVDACITALPIYALNEHQFAAVKHGIKVPVEPEVDTGEVRIYRKEQFIGLGEITPEHELKSRRLVQTDLL
ncbi:MAG: tRNA pseudouridine(55) synthase TruB [Natronospirillum sp.]